MFFAVVGGGGGECGVVAEQQVSRGKSGVTQRVWQATSERNRAHVWCHLAGGWRGVPTADRTNKYQGFKRDGLSYPFFSRFSLHSKSTYQERICRKRERDREGRGALALFALHPRSGQRSSRSAGQIVKVFTTRRTPGVKRANVRGIIGLGEGKPSPPRALPIP